MNHLTNLPHLNQINKLKKTNKAHVTNNMSHLPKGQISYELSLSKCLSRSQLPSHDNFCLDHSERIITLTDVSSCCCHLMKREVTSI